ncbi:hypothetical protein FHW69_001769 [Luteibacter sp. Sphag1AF]|uniref:hypothetical protein n=1 Tax=Luteibacter sp. Sphag1AF TaxID=2587031 RepID=UPI0016111286|nr:hypothetical protein [Luteibacter sp. Sphag1AF]MBB3227168.1 hypothetical protein [Luteibacter sp. Sphag1AF]
MAVTDVYPAPYSEQGTGFAVQAVTHWLRTVPARSAMGLLPGGRDVALPPVPAGLSHRGLEAVTNGYKINSVDVSAAWLAENRTISDRYVAALIAVLAHRSARPDGYSGMLAMQGAVEVFAGPRMDRIDLFADEPDTFRALIDLLRHAPADIRTPVAHAPDAGASRYDHPDFILGTQAWIDGQRVLIEYVSQDTGRPETVALDRHAFADALDRAYYAMANESDRLRAALSHWFPT